MRGATFKSLANIHLNIPTAHISPLWPLRDGNYVAILRPGPKKDVSQILLGQGTSF